MRTRHPLRPRAFAQSQAILALALAGAALLAVATLTLWWRSRSERNVATEAKDYLRERHVKPLDVPLDKLLADSQASSIPTLPHPRLNQSAPDFQLSDHRGRTHSLADHLKRGPVVLVFYYGYYCNHCVSQLFALQDDLSKFHELGAEVIAVSPDTPRETTEKFAKFGGFTFPVLADGQNQIAASYSIYTPRTNTTPQTLLHGTFVIDQAGIVRWCHYDRAPFTDNATLLIELAKLRPSPSR